jgi:benzaldehyde dehydrogenase (NAD)
LASICIGEIGIASPEDVSAAAATAREAQKIWAKVPGAKRGDVLREFSRLLLARSEEIADQIARETGSIRAKAQWEVQMTAREFLEAAALGSQPQGILTADLEAGRQSIARRIPVGVVGIITPWNSPFILGARAIGPALAMGNAVILTPDVQTPVAGGVTFACLLEAAGLPNGLFHVLPGGPETGAALVKEPLVDMISFTGSTRVGRQVASIASEQLKRVSPELGGNNPYIVLDDADIEVAASAGALGSLPPPGTDLAYRRPPSRPRAHCWRLCRSPREKGQGPRRRRDNCKGCESADRRLSQGTLL